MLPVHWLSLLQLRLDQGSESRVSCGVVVDNGGAVSGFVIPVMVTTLSFTFPGYKTEMTDSTLWE